MKTIVLTGGPCAGKTTALVKIMEHFSSIGYKVFIIPELPTLFLQAGMDYLTNNKVKNYKAACSYCMRPRCDGYLCLYEAIALESDNIRRKYE